MDRNLEETLSSSKSLQDDNPALSKVQQDKSNSSSNKGAFSSASAVSTMPSPRSDDHSVSSPTLSESNMANMSPASSSSSCGSTNTATISKSGSSNKDNKDKDKKKTRRSKDIAAPTKDGKKSEGAHYFFYFPDHKYLSFIDL